eukprot:scaffold326070_cov18-Prasinocladus_malaysianus.AAC.1
MSQLTFTELDEHNVSYGTSILLCDPAADMTRYPYPYVENLVATRTVVARGNQNHPVLVFVPYWSSSISAIALRAIRSNGQGTPSRSARATLYP